MKRSTDAHVASATATLAAGLFMALSATAQTAPSSAPGEAPRGLGKLPDFAQLDSDGNGSISKREAQAHPRLKANFNEVDTDKDGSISRAEFGAFEKQMQMPAEE